MRSLVVSTVFLVAVVCLAESELQNRIYSQLGGDLKTFVDRTIIRANQELNYGHLNFEGTGPTSRVTRGSGVVIDVRLRATTCRKAAGTNEYKQRPECPFKRRKVRCMVCSERGARQALLDENYLIDCVWRKEEHTRHALWDARCNPRLTGSGTILSASVDDDGVTPTTDLSNFIQNPSVPVIKALADIPEASVQSQPHRLQVYKGSGFTIHCYIPAQLPNSFFHLTLNDTETPDKEPGASGRAKFLFPAADPAHQGMYRCAYEVTGDDGETFTFRSEPLPLTVYYYDSDDYSVDLSVDE